MITKPESLEEFLSSRQLLQPEELALAKSAAVKEGVALAQSIVRLKIKTEPELMQWVSKQIGVPYVPLRGKQVSVDILDAIPTRIAHHYGVFPVEVLEGVLVMAMAHPEDRQKLDDIRLILGRDVRAVLAGPLEIAEALKRHYGIGAETLDELRPQKASPARASATQIDDLKTLSEDASVIKFVNQLLMEAYETRATDIHLEPYREKMRIRRRVDGVLFDVTAPPSICHFQSAIISRIKVMADLDIAEHRLPQDGRMQVRIGGNDLDLRVSVLPTPFGESVTVRLLTSKLFLELGHLGFFPKDMAYLESLLEKPHGIVLLTGPTGSGKTTTLYAFLNKINREDAKILTIEDPIEYQMDGITQIQVQPKIGLDFARALRSMLRHDPDVMMVGEIRDLETAEIAIRVALTGHLVFSTLHTNDAPGAITRLLDMGLEPFLIASSLECVIAQRLVRLICPHCKEETAPSPSSEDGNIATELPVWCGRGCEHCQFTGYLGRTGIYEMLTVNRDIRELILARASSDQIRQLAFSRGLRTLRQCGWEKIRAGLTTPEEVMRVTMKDEQGQ